VKKVARTRSFGSAVKRLFDVALSLVLLIILAPVMAVIAAIIRLHLGAPVLFRQERIGRAARPFTLVKFRTMNSACDSHGVPLPDERRIGRLGLLLRSTSVDELPELWNVLVGDMSLVGPRPLLPEYLPLYSEEQKRRHEMRPGITGWAQVNGRNAISWEKKFELDVWYIDHWSFWLDVRILYLTLVSVLRAENIAQPDRLTSDKFRGSVR
jgi:lipopolysaccharide/colanic/teichoic acid biosynthesis glycosyltransferase